MMLLWGEGQTPGGAVTLCQHRDGARGPSTAQPSSSPLCPLSPSWVRGGNGAEKTQEDERLSLSSAKGPVQRRCVGGHPLCLVASAGPVWATEETCLLQRGLGTEKILPWNFLGLPLSLAQLGLRFLASENCDSVLGGRADHRAPGMTLMSEKPQPAKDASAPAAPGKGLPLPPAEKRRKAVFREDPNARLDAQEGKTRPSM